jgi:hypothetical protein
MICSDTSCLIPDFSDIFISLSLFLFILLEACQFLLILEETHFH